MHLEAVGFPSLETRSHASLEHKKKKKKRKETGKTFPSTNPRILSATRCSLNISLRLAPCCFLVLDKDVNAEFQWNSIVSNFHDKSVVEKLEGEHLFLAVVNIFQG